MVYKSSEGGSQLFAISLNALRIRAGGGSAVNISVPEENPLKILPSNAAYSLSGVVGLSVCDFWWTRTPLPTSIFVYARLEKLGDRKGYITVFEIVLGEDGTLHLNRQAEPLNISPMGESNILFLNTLPSGRISFNVYHRPPRALKDSVLAMCVAGTDEDGNLLCRSGFAIKCCPRVSDDVVSSMGDVVRMMKN